MAALALARPLPPEPARALARSAAGNFARLVGRGSSMVDGSPCKETRMERAGMYSSSIQNVSPDEHRRRLAAALRKRIGAGIVPKQIADAIGVSTETVLNWAKAYSDPSSHRIGLLMEFFAGIEASPAFWVEVYGHIGELMRARFEKRKRDEIAQLDADEAEIRLLTGTEA